MYVRVIIKSKIGSGVLGTTSNCTYESSALYELYLGMSKKSVPAGIRG